MIDHPCSTCGKLATNASRDVKRVTKPGDVWESYEAHGEARYGCDEHPTRASLYDNDGRLLGALTDDDGRPIPL